VGLRKENYQMEFTPTHRIMLTSSDGVTETIEVMCVRTNGGYACYTETEWETATAADWEIDENGYLWFQGQQAPANHTIEITAL